jgi:PAS domain S-box-containing protein
MRVSIRLKLLSAFGLVVALMMAVGLFGIRQIGQDHTHLSQLAGRVVPITRTVGEISALTNEYRKDQLHYIVADPASRPAGAPGSISGDLSGDLSRMSAELGVAGRLIYEPDDRGLLIAFRSSFARYVSLTAGFRPLSDRGLGQRAARVVGTGAGDREYDRLKALITSWDGRIAGDATSAASAASSSYDLGLMLLIGVLVAAIALSIVVASLVGRTLTCAVWRIGDAAKAIADGDIGQHVKVVGHDELSDMAIDVNHMIDYLASISAVAEAIAAGDLSVEVPPRSDHDTLGRSLGAMTESLRELVSEKERLIEQIPGVVMVLDAHPDGSRCFVFVSPQSETILGVDPTRFLKDPQIFMSSVHAEDRDQVHAAIRVPAAAGHPPLPAEFRFLCPDGTERWLREEAAVVSRHGDVSRIQAVLFDITAAKQAALERERLEMDLRLAQKLEAVGQLAAGVAHEINTPVQFIGDSVTFLKEAADELLSLTFVYRGLLHTEEPIGQDERQARMLAAEQDADLDYLIERVPPAFTRALAGIERVSTIVRAMRQFAHPSTQRAPIDVNDALQTTLIVATNEYKYVADVVLDLGELPPVMANAGDLSQVFLNLIVNAAHAIGTAVADSGERGTITVASRVEGDSVVVTVGDTGGGIPEDIAGRVFDPFFTTKPVGRGTGQGLAISHTIVVERHHGAIGHEPNPGGGTIFRIQLPIDDPAPAHPEDRDAHAPATRLLVS